MKNRKRVKQMQKLISGLTKKKYLFRDVTKKKKHKWFGGCQEQNYKLHYNRTDSKN
jgi:hypothetical protein